jgi:hypothetical protein
MGWPLTAAHPWHLVAWSLTVSVMCSEPEKHRTVQLQAAVAFPQHSSAGNGTFCTELASMPRCSLRAFGWGQAFTQSLSCLGWAGHCRVGMHGSGPTFQ